VPILKYRYVNISLHMVEIFENNYIYFDSTTSFVLKLFGDLVNLILIIKFILRSCLGIIFDPPPQRDLNKLKLHIIKLIV